jgi:DNA-binding transcriptional regulator YiaG
MVTSEQVITARKQLGENQEQFAKRFGVDQATVHRWEKKGIPGRGTAQVALENLLNELAAHQTEAAAQ